MRHAGHKPRQNKTSALQEKHMTLEFGLNGAAPKTSKAVFGARLIWPDDLVHDRTSFPGYETPDGQKLCKWLDSGALRKALDAVTEKLDFNSNRTVVLHEDKTAIVKGNPQGSYGYVYIAAWLKGTK